MKTQGGQGSFSVLLFQDIAVIPILAILPLMANQVITGADHPLDEAHSAAEAAHQTGVAALAG